MKISKREKIGSIIFFTSFITWMHSIIVIAENATYMTRPIYGYFFISFFFWLLGGCLLFVFEDKDFEKEKSRIENLVEK